MELIRIEKKNGENLVSARELHEFLEVKTKYGDWVNRMFEYGFVENEDYTAIAQKKVTAQNNESTYNDHIMSIDMAKEISMIQRSDKGKQARKYFIECEKKLMESAPKLPSDYKSALRELIRLEEDKEKLAIERDEAILTKAYISDKKTATAMNTASRLSKENHKLEIELDRAKDYSTIKRMEIVTGLKFDWRKLKSAGLDLEVESLEVYDSNYGKVKSYHKNVWQEAYALDINL